MSGKRCTTEEKELLFEIVFANQTAIDELLTIPKGIRAKCFFLLNRMKIEGPNLGEPFTKKLSKTEKIFEVRAKGLEGIGRVLYCACIDKKIILLHSFVKKTQKTPKKELEIAINRYKEFFNDKS